MQFKKKNVMLVLTVGLAIMTALSGCGGTTKKTDGKKVNFPTKPINLIVPYAAGGSSDLSARPFADELSRILKQPVVVINKAGAGGGIGAAEVARDKGDGYNVLNASIGNVTIVPYTSAVGYDYKSFKSVAQLTDIPLALSVRADSQIKTLADYIAYAKANPGKIRYGSPGAGNIQHVTFAGWTKSIGIELTHMAYAGANPAIAALLGGHVESTFTGVTEAIPQEKSGAIRILAITGPARIKLVDAPTFKEQGYDLQATLWYGILVPASTPDEVVNILAEAAKKAYDSDKVQDTWNKLYLIPSYLGPKELDKKIANQSAENEKILKEIGLAKK